MARLPSDSSPRPHAVMRISRRSVLALLACLPRAATATYQEGDILVFRGDVLRMPVFPLEDCPFFDRSLRFSPARGVAYTDRQRGYLATWEIDDDTLWLIELSGGRVVPGKGWESLSLEALFPGRLEAGRLRASWFTGLLFSPGSRWGGGGAMPHELEMPCLLEGASLILHVREGCVTRVDDFRGLPPPGPSPCR